ncbi:hypothetical protein WK68_14750 [Burkholderia ubonensis]|nr:hypothetical protein WK68_14750 [Burkholderia ubonensis]
MGFRASAVIDLGRADPSRRWLIAGLWVSALLVCLMVWHDWTLMMQESAQTDLLASRLEALSAQQEIAMQRNLGPTPEDLKLRAAFNPPSGSVSSMLDKIGLALTPDVALLKLDMDVTNRMAAVELEARNVAAALVFQQRLDAQSDLEARIVKTTPKKGDPQNPVIVTLTIALSRGRP